MDTRELREVFAEFGAASWGEDDLATILRALDLLAAVEASADETVRELQECFELASEQYEGKLKLTLDKARAQLTAQSQRIAQLEAENADLKTADRLQRELLVKTMDERDSLRNRLDAPLPVMVKVGAVQIMAGCKVETALRAIESAIAAHPETP